MKIGNIKIDFANKWLLVKRQLCSKGKSWLEIKLRKNLNKEIELIFVGYFYHQPNVGFSKLD